MDFNKTETDLLSSMRESKEEKSLKNLLSRKSFDLRELDEMMCNDNY